MDSIECLCQDRLSNMRPMINSGVILEILMMRNINDERYENEDKDEMDAPICICLLCMFYDDSSRRTFEFF